MPDDWQETTLGEVVSLEYGKALKEADRDGHGYPVFGSAGKVGQHSVPLVPDGPVIVVGRKGTAGSVRWSPGPCSVIDTAYWVRIKDSDIAPEFTFLTLCSLNLPSLSAQTGVPGLNRDRAYSQTLGIPPLVEQRRIVDVVGSIDSYISALEDQLGATRNARAALLFDLLSHPGDDWQEFRLLDVCKVYQPRTIAMAEMRDDGEFVVYGANGPIGRFSEFNHDQPEVVVTCRGATCGTLNKTPPMVWITGNAMVVSPKDERLSKEFLLSALGASDLNQFISGSAQPQITRSTLGQLVLSIPNPIEQARISKLVESFDVQVEALQSQVEAARRLRSGVLSELLSGERLLDESYDVVVGL